MIAGDPAGVEAAADQMAAAGDAFRDVRDSLVAHARQTTAEWTGLASELALNTLLHQASRALIGEEVCHRSARELRNFAAQLRMGQRLYAEAQQRKQAAQADLEAADAAGPAGEAARSGAAERVAQANAEMIAAQQRVESANEQAASQLRRLLGLLAEMVSGMTSGATASSAAPPASPAPKDEEDDGWSFTSIGHVALDVAGMVPVVGNVADGVNAAWYAAEGNYAMASLSAAAMIPVAGQLATGGKFVAKGAQAVAKHADEATDAARRTADGPVVFRGRTKWTKEEHEQLQRYVEASERARREGRLSETGRVSTDGTLRREANKSAMAERLRASQGGTPYQGQVGHAPDTTWTGRADGYEYHDQTSRVNASLGAQSRRYPGGYRPTEFRVGEPLE